MDSDSLMETETEMLTPVRQSVKTEQASDIDINAKNSCETFSHEINTKVVQKPRCESTGGTSPSNTERLESQHSETDSTTSTSSFNFELSDADVNELNKTKADNGNQLSLPNDVSYTEKIGTCIDDDNKTKSTTPPHSEDVDSTGLNKIICFANQDGKITPSPVLQYVLDVQQAFDTIISCADGKIGAHRLVLATASPFIGDMFCSYDHRLGEVAVLVLPDIRVQIMKYLLNFCYTGTMFYPKEEQEEVIETMKLLLFGEFGDLSLKEVTVKVPPQATDSGDNSESRQSEMEQQPCTSASLGEGVDERQDSLTDLLSSSEEDDDEPEHKNEDSSDSDNDSAAQLTEEEQERLKFANNFPKYKKLKEKTCEEDLSINYLIPPRPSGCKTKKLQCYHCPGAFKSMETLAAHLDNNHGLFPESRNLNKSEFDILTHCDVCNSKHSQIASTNQCVSKHSRTRCYTCLEIVRIRDFAQHVKADHGIEQKNGMCIVKCRWCDAGILLQDPIDNKPMSGHCFSSHFPGGRNGGATIDMDEGEEKSELKHKKIEPDQTTTKKPHKTEAVESVYQNPAFTTPSTPKPTNTKTVFNSSASKPSTSSSKINNKAVPAVLMLLQKASQKRKLMQDAEVESEQQYIESPKQFENPKKRVRLDAKGNRMQVAKRTGIPVGRQVYIERLKSGVPTKSTQQNNKKGQGKQKTVLMDVSKIPKIFINIQYSKTFILDRLNDKENNFLVKSADSLNSSGTPTEEIETHGTKKSEPRCSLPCL